MFQYHFPKNNEEMKTTHNNSGFALLPSGQYLSFESVIDDRTAQQKVLLVSTRDRRKPIRVGESPSLNNHPVTNFEARQDSGDNVLSAATAAFLRVHLVVDALLVELFDAAMAVRVAVDAFRFTQAVYRRELCVDVAIVGVTALDGRRPFALDATSAFAFYNGFCQWAQRGSSGIGANSTNLVSF